jgi:hypothetical protein
MEFLADTHLHIYPGHDPGITIRSALSGLRNAARSSNAPCALFLTEGRGHHWFASLKTGGHRLPDAWHVLPTPEPEAVWIDTGNDRVLVLAGRQLVTAERVEILALTLEAAPADGAPAAELMSQVMDQQAVPVLPWAPGKWMFARAKVVENLTQLGGERLRLADSSLRCLGWPTPAILSAARIPPLAGSDPLPAPGEETLAGSYGIRIQLDFDENAPVSSFRKALCNPATPIDIIGNRNTPLGMFRRLIRHHLGKST